MPLSDRDVAYLMDMLNCSQDIIAFTAELTFEEFQSDRMRRLATERQLEVLGEAANHVSEQARSQISSIPWSRVVGLRNKLAHDYGEVLAERVWQIAKEHVQNLRDALAALDEVSNATRPGDESTNDS